MYTNSIILLLSWPVLIYLSWLLVRYVIRQYEKKQADQEVAGPKS
jgi:hypothetical protein